jgi:hypothetical protein
LVALGGYAASEAVARAPRPQREALRDPVTRAQLRAQFERDKPRAHAALRARLPKPHLPAAERAPWIAAWNRMRACAARHGFDGVSAVESTYGDGKTPMPNVDMDGPKAAVAVKACPFELDAGRP